VGSREAWEAGKLVVGGELRSLVVVNSKWKLEPDPCPDPDYPIDHADWSQIVGGRLDTVTNVIQAPTGLRYSVLAVFDGRQRYADVIRVR